MLNGQLMAFFKDQLLLPRLQILEMPNHERKERKPKVHEFFPFLSHNLHYVDKLHHYKDHPCF